MNALDWEVGTATQSCFLEKTHRVGLEKGVIWCGVIVLGTRGYAG